MKYVASHRKSTTDLMFALRVVENYPVTRRVALHPCGSKKTYTGEMGSL